MKILVFSDSHGDRQNMLEATELERPNAIFHLGDGWRDTEDLTCGFPDIPLYQVAGNCDWRVFDVPTEKSVSLGGVHFLLCHGHTFGVKNGYSSALSYARKKGADVLLCGHTHLRFYEDFGGIQLLNPGSIGYSRTYGVITTQRGTAVCCIKTLE